MAYIGPEPNPGQNREVDDISSGFNGSEVNFTLQVNSQNVSPGSSNNIVVSLGGVIQNPSTDYTVAASTLTFTTAPASGLSFFGLVLGQQVDIQSLADGTSPTMSAPSVTGNLSIADKIVHTGDTNTAIRFPAADTVTVETGGSERLRVDSSGNVGIGTSAVESNLHVHVSSASTGPFLRFTNPNGGDGTYLGRISCGDTAGTFLTGINFFKHDTDDGEIRFRSKVAGTNADVMTLVDGNVGLGIATPGESLHIAKTGTPKIKLEDLRTAINNDSEFGNIQFAQKDSNGDGISFEMAATMTDSSNGSCALVFKNNRPSAFAERMRIDSLFFLHNCTTTTGGASSGVYVQEYLGHVYNAIKIRDTANTGSAVAAVFVTGSSTVGTIVQTGSATSYNTSSDYRLKENEEEISNGITRLKLLKPYRFNWKKDPDTRVDGFFAHEAQEVVPEAVTGKKDEIADCDIEGKGITKGQKIYQQMDNAKLIPVLTAALKEAVSKIEVLETKVAALEAA